MTVPINQRTIAMIVAWFQRHDEQTAPGVWSYARSIGVRDPRDERSYEVLGAGEAGNVGSLQDAFDRGVG